MKSLTDQELHEAYVLYFKDFDNPIEEFANFFTLSLDEAERIVNTYRVKFGLDIL